jgi:riboflavin synthase
MFTGIIETIGTITAVRPTGGGQVLSVRIGHLAEDADPGDSIAINGVCLTVSKLAGDIAEFDVSPETLSRSAANSLTVGAKVNLERAMSANSRFGGHIVQGHIDGIGKIKSVKQQGGFWDVSITAPADVMKAIIPKGSVAIDGISLTVATVNHDSFSLAIIPVTWTETILSAKKIGDPVNIETDILVRTVQATLERILPKSQGLTADKLRELGF